MGTAGYCGATLHTDKKQQLLGYPTWWCGRLLQVLLAAVCAEGGSR